MLRLLLFSVTLVEDFVSNWTILLLQVVFLAQISDFSISQKLSHISQHFPKANVPAIATFLIIALPWLAALVTVSIVTGLDGGGYKNCWFHTFTSVKKLFVVSCPTPLLVTTVLLVASAYLRHRRFSSQMGGSMSAELISRGPEVDKVLPYGVMVAAAVFMDIPKMVYFWSDHFAISKSQ